MEMSKSVQNSRKGARIDTDILAHKAWDSVITVGLILQLKIIKHACRNICPDRIRPAI